MTAAPAERFDLPVDGLTLADDFRLDDDPEELAALAASIGRLGVLQPLLVRPFGDGWQVIAGRRRLAAARSVGLAVVPCVSRPCDDGEADEVALAENVHRRHLSPIEEAIGYQRLRTRGLSMAAIGARVGRSGPHVGNLLRLLTLPGDLVDRIHRGGVAYTTVLEHWDEYVAHGRKLSGGKVKARRPGTEDESAAISHWRRRHDRLLAGVQAVLRSRTPEADDVGYRVMLEKLVKLDARPLDAVSAAPDWRERR